MASFQEATRTEYIGTIDNNVFFSGNIHPDFRMVDGKPQGGYLNSIMIDAVFQHMPGQRMVAYNAFFFKQSVVGPCLIELVSLKTRKEGYCVFQVALKQLSTPAPFTTLNAYNPSAYVTKLHTIITTTSRPDGFTFAPLSENDPGLPNFNTQMKPSKMISLAGGVKTLKIFENLDQQDKGELWHAFEWPHGEPIDAKSIGCFADIATIPRPFKQKGLEFRRASLQFEVAYRVPPSKPTQRVFLKITMGNIVNGITDADGWLYDQDGYLLGTARHHISLMKKRGEQKL